VLSEHGIYLRERYLSYDARTYAPAVRAIMLRFFKRLTWAGYQIADAIAPGSEYNRQWQEANGGASERIRPIYNGVDAANFITSRSEPEDPHPCVAGPHRPAEGRRDIASRIRHRAREDPDRSLAHLRAASNQNLDYLERCIALRDSLGLVGAATFEGRVASVIDAYHAGHVSC